MSVSKVKSDCCGCTACYNVCPKDAIRMIPDALGFKYPVVDEAKCVECGLCERVCAFGEDYDKSLLLEKAHSYAAKHKDPEQILASQSGAAFIALSDYVLDRGGIVYGVGYADHFRVVHKRATTKTERDEFRGSKYVQSDMGRIFRKVKQDLREGVCVLFAGTPCQTAGLASFVGPHLREYLYLMDLICHGVPGPTVWTDYLNYLEVKEGRRITAVNFRNKKFGWHSHVESFLFDNTYTNTYTNTFYSHILFRLSCGKCPYTNMARPSDITVGDFWGIENTEAAALGADNKGCSMVLVNTEKGMVWFDGAKESLIYKAVPLEASPQHNLRYPTVLHPKRIVFEEDYARLGFERSMRKYGFLGWKATVRKWMRYLLPVSVKRIVKRLIRQ